jgi:hypothetical protein
VKEIDVAIPATQKAHIAFMQQTGRAAVVAAG